MCFLRIRGLKDIKDLGLLAFQNEWFQRAMEDSRIRVEVEVLGRKETEERWVTKKRELIMVTKMSSCGLEEHGIYAIPSYIQTFYLK